MSVEQDLIRTSVNFSKFHRDKIRGTLLSFTKKVIKETPVDTGRLRGNWQASLNVPELGVLQSKDRGGNNAISDANSAVSALKLGDIFWFTNNLPYARRMEEGGSNQAPQGMLRTNVALLVSKFR
tara:strand:+ start:1594 stop:1968 length:375 start_codon:yes stop_codon:yes gene_type:complete